MREFIERIKLNSSQRAEVQRYFNSMTILSEEIILKITRKMKELERKIDEQKYRH